jgi:hypothetical protein
VTTQNFENQKSHIRKKLLKIWKNVFSKQVLDLF